MNENEQSTVIHGLDEEYHNVELAESKASEREVFQVVPIQDPSSDSAILPATSTDTTVNLDFVESTSGDTKEVTGTLEPPTQAYTSSEWGSMKQTHRPGKAASYLESKGFGWLMEVEDEEEDAKPLL